MNCTWVWSDARGNEEENAKNLKALGQGEQKLWAEDLAGVCVQAGRNQILKVAGGVINKTWGSGEVDFGLVRCAG